MAALNASTSLLLGAREGESQASPEAATLLLRSAS